MVEPSALQLAFDVERLQAEVARLRADREVLAQSLDFHERDRQLVAFEIHDGIIQEMTAALMFFEAAGTQATFATPQLHEQYERGVRILREAVHEARRLIRGLTPIELDPRSLTVSLGKLVEKFRADLGLEIDYRADVKLHHLVPAVEMIVLRIVQEALHNVAKHSHSTQAQVRLTQTADALEVSVQDWGVGFDPAHTPKAHYGLVGIRQRARLLEGQATIDSRPGEGTRVSVRFTVRDTLLPPALVDRAPGGCPTDP